MTNRHHRPDNDESIGDHNSQNTNPNPNNNNNNNLIKVSYLQNIDIQSRIYDAMMPLYILKLVNVQGFIFINFTIEIE